MNVRDSVGEVPESVLFDLGLVYVAIVFVVVFALKIFWPYAMNREYHAELRQALARRKMEASGEAEGKAA